MIEGINEITLDNWDSPDKVMILPPTLIIEYAESSAGIINSLFELFEF